MATARDSSSLNQVQALLERGTFTGVPDARLLERFVEDREEAAFAAIIARHGAMVRNTCRAVLKDPGAADDAFQATFVLLFRKANSIRGGGSLGGWLHRVAYRVALQAGTDAARRRTVETEAGALRTTCSEPDDLASVVHEEVERLADRFRLPIVLCDLEGLSRDEAAARLGWSEGAVRGRLTKGRALLRHRLSRRGVTPVFPLPVPVPETLVAATVKSAAGGVAVPAALALAASVSSRWMGFRLRNSLALMAVLGMGAVLAWQVVRGDRPPVEAVPKGPTIPVEGRVLDLEGRPVAGVEVRLLRINEPPGGRLDAWIDEVKRLARRPYGLGPLIVTGARTRYAATTGRGGRFRIEKVPRGKVITASIQGPDIETAEVYILSEAMPTIRVKDKERLDSETLVYYGARFDYAAAPARAIVGLVHDADSGRPIAGVLIQGMPNIPNSRIPTPGVEATSDAQGRYRLQGLALSRGVRLFTEAPAGAPYINGAFTSPAGDSRPGPLTLDIPLKRGVLVRGRLIDRATRQPVRGAVQYLPFRDNAHLDDYRAMLAESLVTRVLIPGDDGRFTIAALPGRGLLAARAQDDRYLHGVGVEGMRGYKKELQAFETLPHYCMTADQHVLAEIDPAPGTRMVNVELQVDPGRTVTGTVLGPDGRPIAGGFEVRTLDIFQTSVGPVGNGSSFTVTGLPSGPYRLDVIHPARKLAGAIRLTGQETGPLSVRLQPWGTIVGRVVDDEGAPRTDVMIFSAVRDRPDPERGDLVDKPTVDGQGRFRIEGLVPGVRYDALGNVARKAGGTILDGVRVGPGEVKDVGDVLLPSPRNPPG